MEDYKYVEKSQTAERVSGWCQDHYVPVKGNAWGWWWNTNIKHWTFLQLQRLHSWTKFQSFIAIIYLPPAFVWNAAVWGTRVTVYKLEAHRWVRLDDLLYHSLLDTSSAIHDSDKICTIPEPSHAICQVCSWATCSQKIKLRELTRHALNKDAMPLQWLSESPQLL